MQVSCSAAIMRPVTVLLPFALSILGCNEQGLRPHGDVREARGPVAEATDYRTIELPDGSTATVEGYSIEPSVSTVRLAVRFDGVDQREIVVSRRVAEGGRSVWSEEIRSAGVLQFGLSFARRPQTKTLVIDEWTLHDRLTMRVDLRERAREETYILNGRSWSVTRSDDAGADAEQAEQLLSHIGAGSTLFDNAEGERLVGLLSSQGFVEWLRSEQSSGESGTFGIDDEQAQFVCELASACGVLKCTFGGGWANPVCHVCTGTALVCTARGLLCRWIPCS